MIQQTNANTNSQTKNFNSVTGRAVGTRPMPTTPPGNAIPIHRDRTKQCTGVAVRAESEIKVAGGNPVIVVVIRLEPNGIKNRTIGFASIYRREPDP